MATKIQLRRDTSSSWTSTNPVLAQGEPGVETDTGKFKIGDGTTAWASLNYASNGTSTTTGQFINIVAGISSEFPLVNSVSIDGDNWTAPIVVSAYGGAGQEYWEFETYSLAIGNGKVVYLVYGDWPWNSGIATAETALDSPQLQTQECTYVTPDSNKYTITWNSLEFTGGYFVACGFYFSTGYKDVPCFTFSADGENWTWGNVDNTTLIPGLISAESGDTNLIGMSINSASYNGVGWLLTLAWVDDGSPVGTPSNAGAFYLTSLSQACDSSTHISTGGAQYKYGAIAWTGSAWVGTDYEQNIFTNPSLNPAQGSWTTTSIATAQLAAFGDFNALVQTVVTPVGTLNGHNYWILALEDGRLLATKDAGATWQGFVPIPSYDRITAFTSGSTTITVYNEFSSNRVIITGLPIGTFGTGASGLTGGSGTFYVNSTGNPSSGALYSDVGLSQAVTSGASFSSITTTLSQNTLGDDRSVVVTSTTGILIGMAITFASGQLDDGSPNIVTAVDTTNNIVTFSNMLVDNLSSGHSVTFAPAVTYSTGFPVYELCYGNGTLVAVAAPGPYLTFLSTKDLVTWNYTFGSNFTDWLNGPWDANILDDDGFYSSFYAQIAYGDVGNVNNLLTSNNALGSPNVASNLYDEFYLPHSQQSGLMNSLSLGSALNVNVFGIGYGGSAGVNQGGLTIDPNNGYWQLGMGTVYGYGQYESGGFNLSSIGNSNYWSSQENEGGSPDIYISVGGNDDNESTWWFAAQYETGERPSTLVIPYNGVIGIRNNDGGTDNVITVTYYDDITSEPNIAIGPQAGANPTGGNMIAIGYEAGNAYQNNYAIALGARAGKFGQGAGAIAIGAFAAGQWGDSGSAQAANSIIINATANQSQPVYDAGANTLVIKPVRNAVGPTSLYYNSSTGEITYGLGASLRTPANSDFSTNAVPKASADGNWTFSIGSTTGILTVTNSSSGTLSQAYTITYFIAGVATVVNATSSPATTASISLSAGNSALVLANPGDYAQTIFQDLTSNTVYRVTFTVQSSTTGGIIVEQLI